MIHKLRQKNEHIKLHTALHTPSFESYGRVMHDIDVSTFIEFADTHTQIPIENNTYVMSHEVLETHANIKTNISYKAYGGLDIQIGYCNGNNNKLHALEWHNGNEIILAVTDIVLLLAHTWQMDGRTLSTDVVEGFFVPAGVGVEIFSSTMHFAPCKTSNAGFKTVIILPKGTNDNLDDTDTFTDALLFKKNKWLIAHRDRQDLIDAGAVEGLVGENIEVFF